MGDQMTRILLVEDDKSIVINLTEYLPKEGYVIKSASGQNGVIKAENNATKGALFTIRFYKGTV